MSKLEKNSSRTERTRKGASVTDRGNAADLSGGGHGNEGGIFADLHGDDLGSGEAISFHHLAVRVGGKLQTQEQEHATEPVHAFAVPQRTLLAALKRANEKSEDPDTKALEHAFDEHLSGAEDVLIAPMPSAREDRERMNKLVEKLMPPDIPQPVELLQARRSAEMRRNMLTTLGYYSAEELADLHGSKAKNRYALAARWMREGRVFGVPLGARSVFPAFQFDEDSRPYPIIGAVLAELPREDMSPWSVGLWWYARNPALPGDARPAELIGTEDQERLTETARRLAEPLPL